MPDIPQHLYDLVLNLGRCEELKDTGKPVELLQAIREQQVAEAFLRQHARNFYLVKKAGVMRLQAAVQLTSADGRVFEVAKDDRTVWVNSDKGSCVARFGYRLGEVYDEGNPQNIIVSFTCGMSNPLRRQEWIQWKEAVTAQFKLVISEACRPSFVE